jgi:hypothetical protein
MRSNQNQSQISDTRKRRSIFKRGMFMIYLLLRSMRFVFGVFLWDERRSERAELTRTKQHFDCRYQRHGILIGMNPLIAI